MTKDQSGKVDPDAPPSYDASVYSSPQHSMALPSAPSAAPQAPHTTGPPPPVPPPIVPGSPQALLSASPYVTPPNMAVPIAPQVTGPFIGSSSSKPVPPLPVVPPVPAVPAATVPTPGSYVVSNYSGNAMVAMAFSQENRIRLINFPQTLLPSLRTAILQGWGRPVKTERPYHGGYEIEVHGQPWDDIWGEKYVRSRRLLTHLIGSMIVQGFHLAHSFNTTTKEDGKDTLFFAPSAPDPQVHLVTMVFRGADKVVLIDAPQLIPVVRQCLQQHWVKGIQSEKDSDGAHDFKLGGTPFEPLVGETSIQNKMLMVALITCLQPHGYKLYTTVNIDDSRELMETWIFRRVGPVWY
ncbi:hypothetical protein BGW41_000059 [Actinomortierella wolfii]|nr:hypothetical protein BGW41_000059 [Actinomortierella wolfii]